MDLSAFRPPEKTGERVEFRVSGRAQEILAYIEGQLPEKNRSQIMRDAIRLLGFHLMQCANGEEWVTPVPAQHSEEQLMEALRYLGIKPLARSSRLAKYLDSPRP